MPQTYKIQKEHQVDIQPQAIVAMAVYRADKELWLEQAIQSILDQSYTGFVFAIVIDGPVSNDLREIVTRFAKLDKRIMVVECVENQGLSRAMNFVIDWSLASSPVYFFRMDADDISEPERFQTQIEFLEAHPHIDVLGSALCEINEAGRIVGARTLPVSDKAIKRMLPKRCSLNHPTVVLRFNVFKHGFRYSEHLLNTQDYFLWSELASAGFKFTNLTSALLKFRRVDDFYKRRGFSKSVNEFKARIYAMRLLKRTRVRYLIYAVSVLCLRLMPSFVVKFAYKIDRFFLNRGNK
ncbi:glycosyltransferase [Glaciecola sp. KUL10]|uniref:glycosyltransferase n=1 Tax=Glaciecola sp. (strain KUL10) TaxID=2161813 RepID=UPI000D9CF09E|nr:glycosyltransferase [Glaciecola sp. KUL10]GBL04156.1 glycosyltransferase [Glaciecola sp. KUL10]